MSCNTNDKIPKFVRLCLPTGLAKPKKDLSQCERKKWKKQKTKYLVFYQHYNEILTIKTEKQSHFPAQKFFCRLISFLSDWAGTVVAALISQSCIATFFLKLLTVKYLSTYLVCRLSLLNIKPKSRGFDVRMYKEQN